MVELTYTNAEHARIGCLRNFEIDIEFGYVDQASNDFQLTSPVDLALDNGALIFIDGTEYGGIIDGSGIDYTQNPPKRTYTGRTWHGILARKVVMPQGEHYTANGEANACIKALLEYVGFDETLFKASDVKSSFTVKNYQYDRFCDAYTGLRKMLASVGARLSIKREFGHVVLSAVSAESDLVLSGKVASFKAATNSRPVNHLVCAGEGQNNERVVVHLYADENGAVSKTQSLFGLDEVAELYSFTSADTDQITESGTDRLTDYQNSDEASFDLPEDEIKTVGDKVLCYDPNTSLYAQAEVETITVKINELGTTITPTLGKAQASTSSTYVRKA